MQLELIDDPPEEHPDLADGFGHWLAGFIDGEGCFAICRRQRKGYASYGVFMKLTLRDDDAAILHEIVAATGIGSLFIPSQKRYQHNRNQKPQLGWMVASKADCRTLVAILDRYPLRAKKARDYAIWRDAVEFWASQSWYVGGRRGPQDWSPLERLAAELQDVRRWREPEAVIHGT